MTFADLDATIGDKVLTLGVFIPKQDWMEFMHFVDTKTYDEFGEFFWRLHNKIRPFPIPSMLCINGELELKK